MCQCVGVFPDHTSPLVYDAAWSVHKPGSFVSVAGECACVQCMQYIAIYGAEMSINSCRLGC